ncbi:Peptidyl-tRNA hydrolase protein 2 [Binucleata daphniae]
MFDCLVKSNVFWCILGSVLYSLVFSYFYTKKSKTANISKVIDTKLPKTNNVVLKIVVRHELGMKKGKIASQVGHGVSGIMEKLYEKKDLLKIWKENGQPKIVLKASDEEIMEVEKRVKKANIMYQKIYDAGRTQIKSGSYTVLAIGPWDAEDLDLITSSLKLL